MPRADDLDVASAIQCTLDDGWETSVLRVFPLGRQPTVTTLLMVFSQEDMLAHGPAIGEVTRRDCPYPRGGGEHKYMQMVSPCRPMRTSPWSCLFSDDVRGLLPPPLFEFSDASRICQGCVEAGAGVRNAVSRRVKASRVGRSYINHFIGQRPWSQRQPRGHQCSSHDPARGQRATIAIRSSKVTVVVVGLDSLSISRAAHQMLFRQRSSSSFFNFGWSVPRSRLGLLSPRCMVIFRCGTKALTRLLTPLCSCPAMYPGGAWYWTCNRPCSFFEPCNNRP